MNSLALAPDAGSAHGFRHADHPVHGKILIVEPRDGWVEVGHQMDPHRRPHWRRCPPFAVPCRKTDAGDLVPLPYLTVALLRDVCIDGRYDGVRRANPGTPLRRPEDILGPALPEGDHRGVSVPDRLAWCEADVFCRLAAGALADETQAELICWLFASALRPQGSPVWTATRWSDWSYALLSFDHDRDHWFAAPDRHLPDAHPPRAERVLIHPDPEWICRRERGCMASGRGAAFLVLPCDDR
ncbi:MAG TPA: hypothetical protein VD995_30980 [Azospirillum sp.]|nr:hypothetical protein [Azospirillum sp.]